MFVIDKTVEINAPMPLVWQVLTDFGSYREWNPFVLSCQSSLVPGEAIRMDVQLMEKPQKVEEWITESTPGSGFAYRMKPVPLGLLSSARRHELTALPGNRTRYRSYFALMGPLSWLLKLLLGSRLQRGFAGMTTGLQARAEKLAAAR